MNPRLIRAQRGVERRVFLKALALGLSLPVALNLSRLATAQPTSPPKRFFVFYMPHGIAPEHYNPRVEEGDWRNFALDQTNESILGPLEPYKQYVNVYEGFKFPDLDGTHEGIINCLSGVNTLDSTTPRTTRSEERRVGKECRSRWATYREI